jgi:hypothetical protein
MPSSAASCMLRLMLFLNQIKFEDTKRVYRIKDRIKMKNSLVKQRLKFKFCGPDGPFNNMQHLYINILKTTKFQVTESVTIVKELVI